MAPSPEFVWRVKVKQEWETNREGFNAELPQKLRQNHLEDLMTK